MFRYFRKTLPLLFLQRVLNITIPTTNTLVLLIRAIMPSNEDIQIFLLPRKFCLHLFHTFSKINI